MKKWGFVSLLIILFLLPFTVQAQESITLSTLQVQIWPEYDKPTVLVIYSLTLPDTTSLPAALSIRIPTAAGEPNAVAFRQVDGSLFSMDYTRKVSGEWATINFTTTSPQVQIEYYDPSLDKTDSTRHYEYTWPGDYAVSTMTIEVQQPATATSMTISPSFGSGTVASDNLTYYRESIENVAAGQTINVAIDYQKSDDVLSAQNQAIQPSAQVPQGTAQNLDVSTWLPWILGILGAGLIIGGIFWFWQTGRQKPALQNRRKRSKGSATQREESSEAVVYCSQCGRRAAPGDQYCRSCGSPIHAK